MSIIIGIDHGYYAIKTAHCSFPAGLTSYGEHEPYTRQGLLEFGGCFFVCGSGRQPMKRPQYVFRPNLNEPQHRRAWELLQQVPSAKRKEFLVQSILAAEQTDRLEKSIRKVVREELQAVNITNAVPSPLSENAIPDSALDFLNSL
ncbi:hypothetical protein [Gemmiger formicilis]